MTYRLPTRSGFWLSWVRIRIHRKGRRNLQYHLVNKEIISLELSVIDQIWDTLHRYVRREKTSTSESLLKWYPITVRLYINTVRNVSSDIQIQCGDENKLKWKHIKMISRTPEGIYQHKTESYIWYSTTRKRYNKHDWKGLFHVIQTAWSDKPTRERLFHQTSQHNVLIRQTEVRVYYIP